MENKNRDKKTFILFRNGTHSSRSSTQFKVIIRISILFHHAIFIYISNGNKDQSSTHTKCKSLKCIFTVQYRFLLWHKTYPIMAKKHSYGFITFFLRTCVFFAPHRNQVAIHSLCNNFPHFPY